MKFVRRAPAALVLASFFLAPAALSQAAPEITAESLMKHVEFLAGEELQGRRGGTPSEKLAAEYIAAELEKRGVKPLPPGQRFQHFTHGEGESAVKSLNVFGWIPGTSAAATDSPRESIIVLGAHMDHLGARHPGADDNASGVAVALEVAGALEKKRTELRRPVLVIFFGAEERGLLGSRHFVKHGPIACTRIAAMVNIDMIGRPLVDQSVLAPLKKLLRIDDHNSIGVVGAARRPFFAQTVEFACAEAELAVFGTRNIPLVSGIVENMARNRSDHAPFEQVGIPTLFFGSGESDDYHKPGDTADKLVPELMARRAGVILDTVVALCRAPATTIPAHENVSPPAGRKVETLELAAGDLKVELRDNSRSPEILSGVQSLFNVKHAPDFDAFDPEKKGASAGLNLEHIISGHRSSRNSFTPRHGNCDLYRLDDGRSAMLVRRREDSPWDVSSTLRYELKAPHFLDFEFRATPHSQPPFGKRGSAVFFFANYMNDVAEMSIHFLGVKEAGGEEEWIAADAPPGHPHWNRGGTYRHRDAEPLGYDEDHDSSLNSWSYDFPRFTRPFYYGRATRDMVFILMFDKAHSREDEIRFSIFKFKLPRRPRPAWDFQYVIRRVEEGKRYGFRGRVVWKKWVSPEDCLAEYERWKESLGEAR